MPHKRTPTTPRVTPPNNHQLALMIWLAVFPTLTFINLVFVEWLATLNVVIRTLVLVSVAVPIVVYGLMPLLHRVRVWIILRRQAIGNAGVTGSDSMPLA